MSADQDGLQFDTATPRAGTIESGPLSAGVMCVSCQQPVGAEYYDVNGQSVCARCREALALHGEVPTGWGVFARAGLFGLGAALLGAVLYYAVIAITNLEIGIVAIAIGYMVGYAIRAGAGARGGRRFQILAIVLTYWSVGLAYMPMALFSGPDRPAAEPAASGGADAPATDAGFPSAPDEPRERPGVGRVLGFLLAFSFVLPVLYVTSSLPGGAISGAILVFGMLQAWKMTAAPQLEISGPYRVGRGPAV